VMISDDRDWIRRQWGVGVKNVRFSQHALEKLATLATRGFVTTRDAVIETVLSPDKSETDQFPPIAQRRISENTVLRVVYIEDEEGYFIVTFYPGDRKRYED
jgi:hypothetical protein